MIKEINLNIMLNYPVHWTKQQVLRDIIQNFYDDAGIERFGKTFQYVYKEKEIMELSMKSKGFNYEWLVHIGASTKQEISGKFAGFYGEGFKIAALCALRDYHWGIRMRSQNWSLQVTTRESIIDGKKLSQLVYEIDDNQTLSSETVLTIDNFAEEDTILLNDTVKIFYYQDNPLIGKLIFKNDYGAIYERSEIKKPENYPASYDCGGEGIIFLCFQARGSLFAPIVICNHRFKTSDRERKQIYLGTIQDIILDLTDSINPGAAFFLLEKLEKYWYDYPDKQDDVKSWYSVVRKLIRKMCQDNTITAEFRKLYPALLVCEKPSNVRMRNRKHQALAWKNNNDPNARLVQDSFSLLGYKNLIDVCEEAGGFNVTRFPTDAENKLLSILRETAMIVLEGFIPDYPPCYIIDN
ncbi:MAG: hypothetical protein LBT14_00265, partial [Treponema sp.]|nr:hypothetical protein [Treponema sp.]